MTSDSQNTAGKTGSSNWKRARGIQSEEWRAQYGGNFAKSEETEL